MLVELILENLRAYDRPISGDTWGEWFERWLSAPELTLPPAIGYEVSLRLTDDVEMRSLNAQFRQIDKTTDVLSFATLELDAPLLPADLEPEPLYLGDIIISVDTAAKQAIECGYSLHRELAWLAGHGLLHLLGWDHPDDDSLLKMLRQQENFLAVCNL
jgi:probable rRNA maturation factor